MTFGSFLCWLSTVAYCLRFVCPLIGRRFALDGGARARDDQHCSYCPPVGLLNTIGQDGGEDSSGALLCESSLAKVSLTVGWSTRFVNLLSIKVALHLIGQVGGSLGHSSSSSNGQCS